MSQPDENRVVVLHHGTTMRAASSIIREGWTPTNVMDTAARVATAHGLSPADVIRDLETYQMYTIGDGREGPSFRAQPGRCRACMGTARSGSRVGVVLGRTCLTHLTSPSLRG
jgi:hypothetical protein